MRVKTAALTPAFRRHADRAYVARSPTAAATRFSAARARPCRCARLPGSVFASLRPLVLLDKTAGRRLTVAAARSPAAPAPGPTPAAAAAFRTNAAARLTRPAPAAR